MKKIIWIKMNENWKLELLDAIIDNMCDVDGVLETIRNLADYGVSKAELLELNFDRNDIDKAL